jgi:hypothetical protein
MFVLYELESGRAHSQSSESFVNPDDSIYGIKETDKIGIWNQETLDFDLVAASKRMTTLEFMELFTDDEWVGVLDAAKVSSLVNLFVMKMTQAEFMDLNYQGTIDGINGLVSAGLLTQARADEVLNG